MLKTAISLILWASLAFGANDLTGNPLIIDTAGASMLTSSRTWVVAVRWVGGTTAGHTAVVQDVNSRDLWAGIAGTTNWDEESMAPMVWRGGFKVPTLSSGKLYIYLRDQ